jgi:hypothetical protein
MTIYNLIEQIYFFKIGTRCTTNMYACVTHIVKTFLAAIDNADDATTTCETLRPDKEWDFN